MKRYYLSHVGVASKTGDTRDEANHTEPEQVLDLILQTADTPGMPKQIIVIFNRMQRIIRQLSELKNTNECSKMEGRETLGTIVSTRRNSRDLSTGNQSKSVGGRAKSKTSEIKWTESGDLSVHTGFRHVRSQSIQKTVQNKPGTTQKSPEQRQDFSKGTENKLKETQILPVDTEIQPEYTEFKSGETGDKSTDTEIKPGYTEFFPGDTVFKPGDTDFLPGDTGGKSVDTEFSAVDIEIQPVDVENLLGDIQFSLKDIEIRLKCCENLSGNHREYSETTGEKSESCQN